MPENQQKELQLEGAAHPAQAEGQEGVSAGYTSEGTGTLDPSLNAILFPPLSVLGPYSLGTGMPTVISCLGKAELLGAGCLQPSVAEVVRLFKEDATFFSS